MKLTATAAVLSIAAVAVLTSCESGRPTADVRPSATPAGTTVPAATALPAAPLATASTVPLLPGDQPRAAVGGVTILAAGERAQAVAVGTIAQPTRLDVHGWRADFRIDTVLLGPLLLGDTVTVAWEELAASRPVRFAEGERLLLVLDLLPTQSLWRKRFPARERAHTVLVVAARGEAFLAQPDGPTVNALGHYFALTPSARAEAPGSRRLAAIARDADPVIAREALTILDTAPGRVDAMQGEGTDAFLATARNPGRDPALRAAALSLAARHRVPGARETALAETAPASPIRVEAYRALAMLPDGLTAEQAEGLFAEASPELRAVGIQIAGMRIASERLVGLMRDDPAPVVRLAAGRAMLRRADGRITDVVGLLDDPDATVRTGIAESIGTRGADAVAPLRAVVDGGSERAALAAVFGLTNAGRPGSAALAAIGDSHPNEAVRAFAKLGLGEAPGHKH